MRFWLPASLLLLLASTILTLSLRGDSGAANGDGYPHGTTVCLQGRDGPGIRLRLRQRQGCDGWDIYPYLEIDVRELPFAANKSIVIGETNTAFECLDRKTPCKQFTSGRVMLNRVPDTSSGWRAEGWYELKFNTGLLWTGRFKVDCIAPCS